MPASLASFLCGNLSDTLGDRIAGWHPPLILLGCWLQSSGLHKESFASKLLSLAPYKDRPVSGCLHCVFRSQRHWYTKICDGPKLWTLHTILSGLELFSFSNYFLLSSLKYGSFYVVTWLQAFKYFLMSGFQGFVGTDNMEYSNLKNFCVVIVFARRV